MSLIKCNECKKQISDQAMTCPHCGAPVVTKNKDKGWLEKSIKEEEERKKKFEEEEIERIAKLPPAQRLAAERKRKERLENEEKNNRRIGLIILIVIILLVVGVIRSCQKTPDEIARDAERDRESALELEKISKENAFEDDIKDHMKDSDSYEHIGTSYGRDSNGKEIMTVKYKGTNGFGAVVTEEQTTYVNP